MSPCPCLQIFGPVLPCLTVASIDDAIALINRGEKPLALYVFSNRNAVVKRFRRETSSGAILVNDTILHFAVDTLPFGGVGNSGVGNYHGRFSFECFSHTKAILHKDFNPIGETLAA